MKGKIEMKNESLKSNPLWLTLLMFGFIAFLIYTFFFGGCSVAHAQTNESVTLSNSVPVVTHLQIDPATIQSQFNSWSALLMIIGGFTVHLLHQCAAAWSSVGGNSGFKLWIKTGKSTPEVTLKPLP